MLNLDMPGKRAEGAIDHHLVRTQLQRDQEHQQDIAKHHGPYRQPGTPTVAPQIAPGQ